MRPCALTQVGNANETSPELTIALFSAWLSFDHQLDRSKAFPDDLSRDIRREVMTMVRYRFITLLVSVRGKWTGCLCCCAVVLFCGSN